MRFWVYAVRRVVLAVPVLIGVMTVLFVLISGLPTSVRACSFYPPNGKFSPCTNTIVCPDNPSQLCPNPVYQSAVNALGLNQPIYVQWAIYIGDTLTFHWGYVSQVSALGLGQTSSGLPGLAGHSVTSVLATNLPYSLELIILALAIAFLVVVPLYSRATARPGGAAEYSARALTIAGFSISIIVLGSIALFGAASALAGPGGLGAPSPICGGTNTVFLDFFGSWPVPPCPSLYGTTNLGPVGYPNWLSLGYASTPTGFPTVDAALHGQFWLALDTLFRMAIPALLLALVATGAFFRVARYAPTERMNLEFLRGERARGLPESKVFPRKARRHALSASLPALVPSLSWVFANLCLVEIIFNLWGVGRIFAFAVIGNIKQWDFGLVFGTALLFAYLIVATDIFASLLRAYIDPRTLPK